MSELYHHGILGQKWGVRRYQNEDGSYTNAGKERRKQWADNYSTEQRIRDKRVYSGGAVRRINNRMKKGEGIQSARSVEASRIDNYRNAATVGREVGSVVGGVAGAVGGFVLAKKVLPKYLNTIGTDPITSFAITGIVSAGSAKVGQMIGRRLGSVPIMMVGGYSPNKYR